MTSMTRITVTLGLAIIACLIIGILFRFRATPRPLRVNSKELLTLEAKLPGRLQVMAFVWRDTPLEHVRVCYEAGKRYGAIE